MAKKAKTRTEHDSMGTMTVPADVLFGASTQRAVLNFPISDRPVGHEVIHAFALLKHAAADTNHELGKLTEKRRRLIVNACKRIAADLDGDVGTRLEMMRNFPVDVFQTGSGTSSNMNTNEVVSNMACLAAGAKIGAQDPVHPNDHVNMGQSSNDTFPTAMQVAACVRIKNDLLPALTTLSRSLHRKAKQFDKYVKIGRTHLQDATPIRLGQEFSGYAAQIDHAIARAKRAVEAMASNLPIGGTAVGTGINTHPKFGRMVASRLSKMTGVRFREAGNHFEAQATRDCIVEAHGLLRTISISMSKIASDIRLMGSGPRASWFEIILPELQPGSSIMPGKVNPVLVESVMQVTAQVEGNDVTIGVGAMGGVGSIMELNMSMPCMAERLLESVQLLSRVSNLFADNCIAGLKANRKRIDETVEQSLMLGTALAPVIGYNKAAEIAHHAYETGQTIREYCLANDILDAARLDEVLDVSEMTHPH
ncbi:MAG: aspartate ammonia-lyase [Phycisphaerae bacterium]|nr:aspartate ammonia-lyase [Phycisphaerae bacterium]|tara:strand:+ start:26583 stop:28022 length:1440 start_codon:yes stop_codon:yes gene_type:complete